MTTSIYPEDYSHPIESSKKPNIPYTYLIGWSTLNIWYYGAQYGKKSHPNNLWTTYFTSSNYVKKFRKEHGEPDVVEVRQKFKEGEGEKARVWEFRVIKKMKMVYLDIWLNMCNQGKYFCCTPESCQKISNINKGKKKPPFSIEHRQHLSKSGKGKRTGWLWWTNGVKNVRLSPDVTPSKEWSRGRSQESRQNISKGHKGKGKGKFCWTDGIKNYYLFPDETPQEGWVNGGKSFSPNVCQYLSEIGKGKRTGWIWWNNGIKNYIRPPNEPPQEGWVRGKLPGSIESYQNISKGKSGKVCYTNGIKNFYISPNESPQEGWILGSKPKSPEQIEAYKRTCEKRKQLKQNSV